MMMVGMVAVTAVPTAAQGRRRLIIAARICCAAAGRRRLWLDDGGDAGRIRLSPNVFRVGQFVVLLVFHAPVLEPDLDLSFGEAKRMRNLYSPAAGQIAVKVELLKAKQEQWLFWIAFLISSWVNFKCSWLMLHFSSNTNHQNELVTDHYIV
jgi:hypothetical protein